MQAVPQDIAALVVKNTAQKAQLAERDGRLAECSEPIAWLNESIAEHERMKGKNSRNSGKPPSSDNLGQPRAKERQRRGSRSSGGQPGRCGTTLRRSETPDRIVDHVPNVCGHRGLEQPEAALPNLVDWEVEIHHDRQDRTWIPCPMAKIERQVGRGSSTFRCATHTNAPRQRTF